MIPLPSVRPGLLRHHLDDQVIVYNPSEDRAHLLDATTSTVLDLLDKPGQTAEGMVAELAGRVGGPHAEALLALSIEELRMAELLDNRTFVTPALSDVTRRGLVRRIGLAAASAPDTGDRHIDGLAGVRAGKLHSDWSGLHRGRAVLHRRKWRSALPSHRHRPSGRVLPRHLS